MAQLEDLSLGAVDSNDPQKQLDAVVKQVNEHARLVSNEDKTKIVKSDSGVETLTMGQLLGGGNGVLIRDSTSTPRGLFGEYPDGTVALKLSQTGVDVTTAANSQLIWSSDFNSFKIVASPSIVVATKPANTTNYTLEIPHLLGYQPAVLAFVNAANSYFSTPFVQIDQTTGVTLEQTRVEVDSTSVYIDIITPNTGSNILYTTSVSRGLKYYLLQETAN